VKRLSRREGAGRALRHCARRGFASVRCRTLPDVRSVRRGRDRGRRVALAVALFQHGGISV